MLRCVIVAHVREASKEIFTAGIIISVANKICLFACEIPVDRMQKLLPILFFQFVYTGSSVADLYCDREKAIKEASEKDREECRLR